MRINSYDQNEQLQSTHKISPDYPYSISCSECLAGADHSLLQHEALRGVTGIRKSSVDAIPTISDEYSNTNLNNLWTIARAGYEVVNVLFMRSALDSPEWAIYSQALDELLYARQFATALAFCSQKR